MKKIFLGVWVMAAILTGSAEAKDVKILLIGNSFSLPITRYLDKIVKSVSGHRVRVVSCYIGGCSFERHWQNIELARKNILANPYRISVRDSALAENPKETRGNVLDLLRKEKWDVVTIQQASPGSWNYETYQPYADNLISVIREAAPQAEIVIQQTWSYREDDYRLNPAHKAYWGFDQNGMYDRLTEAYGKLAVAQKLRVIPTGYAVQLWRKNHPGKKADVVGSEYKERNGKLKVDPIHLNRAGEYMQNCVWYGFLFGESPEKTAYRPTFLTEDEAKLYRSVAAEALKNNPF